MIGIYKITNPSNKIYIGSTNNFKRRFLEYKYKKCKDQRRLYNSFQKYGVENHIFEILEECLFEELNIKERYWQEYYNVLDKKLGLNCLYVETFEKRKMVSDETRQKHSFNNSGEKNNNFGKKRTDQVKKKISNANKGRKRSEIFKKELKIRMMGNTFSKLNKILLDTNMGIYYESINKAAIALNINYSTLKAMLSGRFKNKTNLIYV